MLAGALKTIYRAPTRAAAEETLDSFEAGPWGEKYPAIVRSWRSAWERVAPFFAFSQPIRRAVYTTNALESLNSTVRRAVRIRGHFPNDRAATWLGGGSRPAPRSSGGQSRPSCYSDQVRSGRLDPATTAQTRNF